MLRTVPLGNYLRRNICVTNIKDSAAEEIYAKGDTEQKKEKERRNERNLKAYIVYEQ